ncbi:MAG: MnhB domain-containing protein [Desulfobacterales bacterium]
MTPSLILRTATRLLVGMILMFSIYLLLRGHNAPGGGFSGALVAGTGFALYAIAEGAASVRLAIRIDPRLIIVFGIVLSAFTGLIPGLVGQPFLTGIWWSITAFSDLDIMIGTPIFFDIGVFSIVLGTILTLILALEEDLEGI